MPISVSCGSCFCTFTARDEHAGKRGKCPHCGEPVRIPASGGTAMRSADPAPMPRRPASHRKKNNGPQPVLLLSVGGGVALLLLVAFLAYGAGRSDAVPVAANAPAAPVEQQSTFAAPAAPAVSSVAPSEQPLGQQAAVLESQPAVVTEAALTTSSPPAAAVEATAAPTEAGEAPAETPDQWPPARSLADLIEAIEPSVVRIDTVSTEGKGRGSGFVIDKEGTIATNYHVVTGAAKATVTFPDGAQFPVLGYLKLDGKRDIALLKIECPPDKLNPLPLAATAPRKGESVVGFGAPLGLSFSASEGIISAIRTAQDLKDTVHLGVEGTWIQTTTPISPGNSGGPLVNMRGEVVGANTMILTQGQNLNLAISSLDILEASKARSDKLLPLDPESTPEVAKSARGKLVDEIGTARGKKLLAGIKRIDLIVLGFQQDPTGRVEQLVLGRAEETLKRCDLERAGPRDSSEAAMIVIMALGASGRGAVGTQELLITAFVACQDDESPNGAVRVWKAEDTVGTLSAASLFRGVIPRKTDANVAAFFKKFIVAFREAQREVAGAESAEADVKAAKPAA